MVDGFISRKTNSDQNSLFLKSPVETGLFCFWKQRDKRMHLVYLERLPLIRCLNR
jgi:hypothetical protein